MPDTPISQPDKAAKAALSNTTGPVSEGVTQADPSHYCVACAARWFHHADGTWSLRSKECGPCCDNIPMDAAPIVEFEADGTIDSRKADRVRGALEEAARVADEYADSSTPTRDTIDIVRHDEAKGIATAIRALAKGGK